MRIRWNTVAEYVESGELTATVMDGEVATDHGVTLVLDKVFSGWKKMPPHERYAAGNGAKQIVSDGATKGTAREKVEKIENNFSDLIAGVMPGTGSKVSLIVKALARRFDVDDSTALKAWDGYSDDKKAEAMTDKINKKFVAEIKQERLDASVAAIGEANESEVEFTL